MWNLRNKTNKKKKKKKRGREANQQSLSYKEQTDGFQRGAEDRLSR